MGDGWLPYRTSANEIRRSRDAIGELAEAAGRDPRTVRITAFGHPGQYTSSEAVAELIDAGANRVTIWLEQTEGDSALEKWTALCGGFSPDPKAMRARPVHPATAFPRALPFQARRPGAKASCAMPQEDRSGGAPSSQAQRSYSVVIRIRLGRKGEATRHPSVGQQPGLEKRTGVFGFVPVSGSARQPTPFGNALTPFLDMALLTGALA